MEVIQHFPKLHHNERYYEVNVLNNGLLRRVFIHIENNEIIFEVLCKYAEEKIKIIFFIQHETGKLINEITNYLKGGNYEIKQ